MKEISAKVKSFEEVWEKDKELLRLYPGLQINWSSELPSNQDAQKILIEKGNKWENPTEPFELDEASLNKTLEWLLPELEKVWGATLEEKPDIEIVPNNMYLQRINKLEREVNEMFGFGELCRSPPTMYHFATHGKLLIPCKYPVRVPKKRYTTDVGSADFDVLELAWDKPFFEEVLFEELSHVLFRQLRGEWKEDYVKSMKSVGEDNEYLISVINEVMAQYAKEAVAKPDWALYVAGEKISVVWGNRQGMNIYRAVDALAGKFKLSQIAMLDEMLVFPNTVVFRLHKKHPHYEKKKEKWC